MLRALVSSCRAVRIALRPNCTALNPHLHRCDLGSRKRLALRRHAVVVIAARDSLKQRRSVRFARHNSRPVVSAFEGERLRIQPQFALLLFLAVTFHAVLLQQRPDFLFEIGGRGCAHSGEEYECRAVYSLCNPPNPFRLGEIIVPGARRATHARLQRGLRRRHDSRWCVVDMTDRMKSATSISDVCRQYSRPEKT